MILLLPLTIFTLHATSFFLGRHDEISVVNNIYRYSYNPTKYSNIFDSSFEYFDCYNTTFDLRLFMMAFVDLYKKRNIGVKVEDKFHFDMVTDLFDIRFERNETSEGLKIVKAKARKCTRKFKSLTIDRILKNSIERDNPKLLEDFSKNFSSANCNGNMDRDKFIENFLYDSEYRIKGKVISASIHSNDELFFDFEGKKFSIQFQAERKPENPHEFMLVKAYEYQCEQDLKSRRGVKMRAKELQEKLLEQNDTEELKKLIDPKFIFYDCGHFKHDRDEYLEKGMLKTTLSNGIVGKARISNDNVIYMVQSGGSNYSNVAYIIEDEKNEANEKKLILLSSSKVNC